MPDSLESKEKILAEYKKQTDKIIRQMYSILVRAHRKVDDLQYRRIINKLHKL